VDGVYVANVADEQAQPELKLLGGLQAVLFNIHVCSLQHTATHGNIRHHNAAHCNTHGFTPMYVHKASIMTR